MPGANSKDEVERLKYLRETNVHHLFELLASRVLTNRPQNVFGYLREQLNEIENAEQKTKTSPTSTVNQEEQQQQKPTTGAAQPQPQQGTMKLTLAVFGLDNAGKTALIHSIGGTPNSNTTPTVGFSPTFFETETADVAMFDLGGGASFRSIWKHYFHDVHGIIYVVDGSDERRLEESHKALQDLLTHPYMQDKPVLLYINKSDKKSEFLGVDTVVSRLGVAANMTTNNNNNNNNLKVFPICALNGEDPAIESGVEWLLGSVKDRFDQLSKMVSAHSAEVKLEKKKALEEQQKRVEAARAAEAAGN